MYFFKKILQPCSLVIKLPKVSNFKRFFQKAKPLQINNQYRKPEKRNNRVQGILKNGNNKTVGKRNDASRSSGF